MPTIAVLGTMDTKGSEHAFVAERILVTTQAVQGEPALLFTRAALFLAAVTALFPTGFFTEGEREILGRLIGREKAR